MKDTIQTITAIPNVSPLDFEKETTPKKKPPATKKKSRKSTKTPKTKQPKLNQPKSTNLSEIKIQPEPESESTRKSRESPSVIPVEPKPLTEAQTQPPSTKRKKLPRLSKKKSTQNSDPIQPPVDSSEPAQEIKTSPQITKKEEQIITIAEVPQAKKREVTKSLRKKMEKKSTNKRKTRTSKQTKELKTENNCRKARKKRSKKSRAGNSDSSEEDCFTDQFVFELNDEFDFVCLTEADIIAEQTREITEVSEILSISESATITLLKHFKWNRDKLMTEYFDNPSRVLESAGVGEDSISPVSIATPKGSEKIKAKTDEKIECTICSMDVLPSEMYSLETCGHSFCDCCWESYLTIQIKEGQAFVNCAQLGCSALVPENDVKKLVEPAVFQKYCTFFMQSFVDNNDNVKWCPAPGCGNAVTSDMISDKTVTCACSYRFCFQCSEEAHQPASCAQVKLWRKKCADESETNNWIIANTQECPKCSLPTEKNGGCNHMTCRQCKHEYCWICYKDWKGHNDYYNCNRYQKSKDDKKSSKKNSRKERELQRLEMRKALEKYLHYHSRFMNHSKSSELEATSEKAMKQMHQMRETEATDAEVIFIEQATKQLSIARSVLKYSYVRRYYMDDEDNSTALFEFFQEDLEKTAEELSENLANPMANKFHIVNLTTLIETHIHNMIAAVDTNQN